MQSQDNEIVNLAEKASLLLRIPPRLIASWWIAENGWTWRADNNPGNISYTGEGNSDPIGVFAGVVDVQPNKVCTYKNAADGVNAFVLLLELPLSAKDLTLTAQELRGKTITEMCQLIGDSNWAASHYRTTWNGGSIYDVYTCADMDAWYGPLDLPKTTELPVKKVYSRTYLIVRGDTLDYIAKRFLIPIEILVRANHIVNANEISVGEVINLPLVIRVKSGDTLTKIAEQNDTTVAEIVSLNHIQNPDFIRTGQILYVL